MKVQNNIPPRVTPLHQSRCPPAIGFAISLFVVASLQGVSFGANTHVCEKVVKHFPSLAYTDASATVMHVVTICHIGAASNHGLPGLVRNCAAHTMPPSVGPKYSIATATFRFAVAKLCGAHSPEVTAFALAPPKPLPLLGAPIPPENCPAPESLPRQVFCLRRLLDKLSSSHRNLLCRFVVVRAAGEVQLTSGSLIVAENKNTYNPCLEVP